jgi:uncharacterized protein (DUF58 family)
LELPRAGEVRFRDPETNREVLVNTDDPQLRAAYSELLLKREAALLRVFRGAKVDVLELSTAQDLVLPLLRFVRRRRRARYA